MDDQIVIRKRTLRRQQRTEILNDLLHDIDIIETKRDACKTKVGYAAYERLHEILYANYCTLVDSEV